MQPRIAAAPRSESRYDGLRSLVADLSLDKTVLQESLRKKVKPAQVRTVVAWANVAPAVGFDPDVILRNRSSSLCRSRFPGLSFCPCGLKAIRAANGPCRGSVPTHEVSRFCDPSGSAEDSLQRSAVVRLTCYVGSSKGKGPHRNAVGQGRSPRLAFHVFPQHAADRMPL